MFRSKVTALLGTVVLAAVGLGVAPAPASASHDCVSKREFYKVHQGMSRDRVTRIFDVTGRVTSTYTSGGTNYTTRNYNPCPRYSTVSVDFENGRVTGKYAYWGN